MAVVLVEPPAAAGSEECRVSDRFPESGLIEGFGDGEDQLLSQGEEEEGVVVLVVVVELSVVERIEENDLTREGFRKEEEDEKKRK